MSKGGSRVLGVVTVLSLVGMGLLFLAAVLDQGRRIDNPTPVITAIAGAAIFAALFIGPVGRAIAKMLESDGHSDEDTTIRFEDYEARLAEMSIEQQRMAELEERLDFAERLLSTREGGSIGRGGA